MLTGYLAERGRETYLHHFKFNVDNSQHTSIEWQLGLVLFPFADALYVKHCDGHLSVHAFLFLHCREDFSIKVTRLLIQTCDM